LALVAVFWDILVKFGPIVGYISRADYGSRLQIFQSEIFDTAGLALRRFINGEWHPWGSVIVYLDPENGGLLTGVEMLLSLL